MSETALKAVPSLVPVVGGHSPRSLATRWIVEESEHGRPLASSPSPSMPVSWSLDSKTIATSSALRPGGRGCARTTLREKRRAMAGSVSRAVLDTAGVDESQLTIAALSDLDVPHLRELEAFRRRADAAEPDRGYAAARMIETSTSRMLSPIEAALMRHGCIWSTSLSVMGGSTTHWGLTGFGRTLLDELQGDDSGGA